MRRFQTYENIGLRTFAMILVVAFWGEIVFSQQVFVSSRNTHEVKLYDFATSAFIKNFVTAGSGGLSFPQEVVWHPDGFLLVTGRGNTAVKKYDGGTGAYLGNFTSGYLLDNPTKTTIWQDSLLYVSQWGTTKNKVVRFDLKTGAFVDEFTNVGIPNGCGHAWDADGNLLVAQYGNGTNGKVWKFDPNGTFISDFIPTTLLQGPVNLWFDTAGSLLVADWSLGEVLQFDTTGAFQSKLVTGLANVEGYAFDSQGNLYLCDWTANKVFKYDFAANALTPFLQTGGMMAPNSILIRESASSSALEKSSENIFLSISPNPANEAVRVDYFLEKTADVRVEIMNALGQNVATIFSGKQTAGEHQILWNGLMENGLRASAGVYFVRLTVGQDARTAKLVWQQ